MDLMLHKRCAADGVALFREYILVFLYEPAADLSVAQKRANQVSVATDPQLEIGPSAQR